MADRVEIRRATEADGEVLTALVRRSSAYAGEYHSIVERVVISPEQIRRDHVYACELDGRVVGFYSLVAGGAELDYMFVANDVLGTGIGRCLFEHMKVTARRLGCESVLIVAHPPAEAFYTRMGARRIGIEPAAGHVSWARPRMLLELS